MYDVVEALIEIPKGSKNKYEVDKKTGRVKLDRVLYSAISYPAEYGYIENTLSPDGDPLDILVLTSEATFPGCMIDAKIIGFLNTIDSGEEDNKIIAVNVNDPRFNYIESLDQVNPHTLREIENFFKTYKILQNKEVVTGGYHSKDEAIALLEECKKRYQEEK